MFASATKEEKEDTTAFASLPHMSNFLAELRDAAACEALNQY
jgi:hypothetical protein